jgi:hypothetical protein
MGENWQAEIETTNSTILPFTTASFHYGTTPFCRPSPSASKCGGKLAAMLSLARQSLGPVFGSALIVWINRKGPFVDSQSPPKASRCAQTRHAV